MASKTDFDPVPSSLVVGKEISRGSYGVVYSAELDRKPVAVKRVHEALIDSRGGGHTLEKFKAECDQMKALNHPHVVGFIGAYKDKKGPVLVMELMDESLEKYLERNRERLSSERIWEICSSVCEGLAYLHGRYKPIIHRDVGSRNVLLTKGGVVKIADFGQAKLLKNKAEIIQTTQPGAIVYMPPEALTKKKEYSAKVDSFSLGVLLLEICTQHPPTSGWDGINTVIEVIRREDDLNMLDDTHPLKPIIIWCLQHEKLRPAVGVIRDHVARSNSVHNNAQRIATLEVELQNVKHEIECERVHVTELEAALKFANEEKAQQICSLQRERDKLQKELDEYKACQKVKESADNSKKKPAPDHFSPTMSSGHVPPPEYYIALQNVPLVKDGSSILKKAKDYLIGSGSGYVLKGDLLLGDGHSESGMFSGSLVSDPSKRVVCPMLYVSYVTDSEYMLLAPVKQLGDRLVLFNNKEKLHPIERLQVNSNVWVSLPTSASGSTCRNGTIKYIGPIKGEEGHHFGIELKVAMGTCDGTLRKKRYFTCKDGYGIFLTAFNLNITSRAQANTVERRSVILPSDKSQTGRTFYEDDEVAVYSTGGKRVTGRAKWAYPVSDKDQQKYYVIGIETDKPNIPHSKIEGHHTNMSHIFKCTKDYTKHSYIAVPEVSVFKDEEDQHGTPVEGQDPQLRNYDLIPERSIILPSDKSQTGRTFYEDDEVAVYSTDGKQVTGRAKWAYPVSDKDQQKYYVIGIETDKPNVPHSKIEGYHTGMLHYFKNKDYIHHSYIAVPEVSVIKDEEHQPGTFVLIPDPLYVHVPQGSNPLEKELDGKNVVLEEAVEAPKGKDLTKFIGERRGIQGHQNSCYLDSTLFAMYGFTGVFDELILQQPQDDFAADIVKIMSSEIIYPLRINGIVSFDHVMKLRNTLGKLVQIKGLTHVEQDPEEFLNLLFKHVLKLTDEDAFIHLKRRSGKDTEFFLQLFMEKSETTLFTMKEMLFKCMREQNISFTEAPGRLIIQLPRYGKEYKVYERVYPELHMDVSDICADYIPPKILCNICFAMPEFYCSDCGIDIFRGGRLFLCAQCNSTVHCHLDHQKHKPQRFDLKTASTRKVKLDLLSVVCIEKSHYVCFCRHGNRWFFFDSMADRTDDGFNIPCIQECQEIADGLSDIEILRKKQPSTLPPLLRRLVNDASICIYIDPEVEMY